MATIHRAIAFMILGLSFILLAAYISSNNSYFSNLSLPSFSLPSGFFTKTFHKDSTSNEIFAKILLNGTQYNDICIKSEEGIDFSIFSNAFSFNVDSGTFVVYGNVTFENYTGTLCYSPTTSHLYMKGKTSKIFFNNGYFFKESNIFVNTSLSSHDIIKLNNIKEEKMQLKEFTGRIHILAEGDEINYKVTQKEVNLKKIEAQIEIKGSYIMLKGNGIIETSSLMSPTMQ